MICACGPPRSPFMFRILPIALVLAVASLAACSSETIQGDATPDTLPLPAPQAFEYRVGPGDVLRVNVAGHPELSSAPLRSGVTGSPVDGSGKIQLPYIGEVEVSGKTVFEVKASVELLLERFLKKPMADVAVVEFGSQRVYVLGEVNKPGMFVLDRPLTASQILALTGGFTSDANREQIALVRGRVAPENIVLFDADSLNSGGDFFVAAGDMVFVGRRAWSGVAAAARDLVPILQILALPVGTARDVALIQDYQRR
jgi:protein involved in polysaccharide export with SLBB domain